MPASPADAMHDAPKELQGVTSSEQSGDAGIGVSSVLVMLALLAILVVGIFWALPAWFGGQVIEVTIRN